MNSERRTPGSDLDARLRAHLSAAAGRLADPPGRLEAVRARARRRQAVRGALAAIAVATLVAVPVVAGVFDRPTVMIDSGPTLPSPSPGAGTDPPSPPADPAPEPDPEPEPDLDPEPGPGPEPDTGQEPASLPGPLLAYGGPDDRLELVDRTGARTLWPAAVAVAAPDGRGGVLLQPADEAAVVWLPEGAGDSPVRLVEVDGELLLRGVSPGGEALYSVRATGGTPSEDDVEDFFAVDLADGATPQRIASAGAYETWTVGPAVAAGRAVHASCHIHCTLWPGLPGETPAADPLYHGGGSEAGPAAAIEGLTATPDGRVLGFVEFDPAMPDLRPLELVLLDGSSFEVLARVPVPLPADTHPGTPTLSLSADGQRALVTAGGDVTGAPPVDVPQIPFVVHGALTADPLVLPVEFEGVLRWADPLAASGAGGPVTEAEGRSAEALIAFAKDRAAFDDVPLAAEVRLGLGEDLVGPPRAAADLADPERWLLEPEQGDFRALVGPFSALDILARSREVVITSGPHAHCVAPPVPPPLELEGLRHIAVQPTGIDSCLQWWTVDLFLTDGGEIAAVTLDLWEP